MRYRADNPVIRSDTHMDTQTKATTIPIGQKWPRIKIIWLYNFDRMYSFIVYWYITSVCHEYITG